MFYQVNKISDHITQIMDVSGVSTFLITGEKEALLGSTPVSVLSVLRKRWRS